MTGEQPGLAGMESAAEVEADRAAREDDPTPRELVRAVLAEVAKRERWRSALEPKPMHVLDVCAGFGSWAMMMRSLAARMGWPVHITGVEIDERKRPHLEKWCDEVVIGDWIMAPLGDRAKRSPPRFDLVIGNPHFSALTHEDHKWSMPAVLLRHAPAVLLFHQMASFTRSVAGRDTWRAYPPAWVGLVPGSVGFRGRSRGADLRSYQATLWLRGHEGPAETVLLPEPPNRVKGGNSVRSSSWHWDVPPGTEEPSAELPAAPGWVSAHAAQ